MNKPLILGIAALLALLFFTLRATTPDLAASDFSQEHDIVMFTAPWCGVCDQARRHLDRRGVAYLELDIEASASARQQFEQAAGRGVPLAYFGEQRISGFSPTLYDQALRLGSTD